MDKVEEKIVNAGIKLASKYNINTFEQITNLTKITKKIEVFDVVNKENKIVLICKNFKVDEKGNLAHFEYSFNNNDVEVKILSEDLPVGENDYIHKKDLENNEIYKKAEEILKAKYIERLKKIITKQQKKEWQINLNKELIKANNSFNKKENNSFESYKNICLNFLKYVIESEEFKIAKIEFSDDLLTYGMNFYLYPLKNEKLFCLLNVANETDYILTMLYNDIYSKLVIQEHIDNVLKEIKVKSNYYQKLKK